MTEDQARAVVLLQSVEASPESDLWTAADRQWATRAAPQGLPADASRAALIVERARVAMQRLAPRDAGLQRWLAGRSWRPAWPLLALLTGCALGGVSDALVAGAYFNLLSPLFWGLLAWNVAVYAGIALGAVLGHDGRLRTALASLLARRGRALGRWPELAARWVAASGPLTLTRAAVLMHTLAAGMALGLVAGLLLRGLVLDYRAGWATTLLAPETVRAALAMLFQPAWALTGQASPGAAAFEALRVVSGQSATATAAPWIVLMATQLIVVVVLPRLGLAGLALWRGRRLAADFPLALDGPGFDRWLPGRPTAVWVLPHGQAPSEPTLAGLRVLLDGLWGAGGQITVADPVPWGDEDVPPPLPSGARAVLLVDLATTPEAEVHGRLLQALGAVEPLVLADAHGFTRRFGSGDRLAERRRAWRALLGAVPFVSADLGLADQTAAIRDARLALGD